MASRDRWDRASAAALAVWVAVLSTLAGYAETTDQRLAALILCVFTASVPALATSKETRCAFSIRLTLAGDLERPHVRPLVTSTVDFTGTTGRRLEGLPDAVVPHLS